LLRGRGEVDVLRIAKSLSLASLVATLLGFIGTAGAPLALAKYSAFLLLVVLLLILGFTETKNVA
jgi:uncharacterized membrane protein YtjA (UPF0391 family)